MEAGTHWRCALHARRCTLTLAIPLVLLLVLLLQNALDLPRG